MDRFDERDERKDAPVDEVVEREGDVLGLGGSSVPKAPGDPTVSHDPESVRKRRMRAHEGEIEDQRDDDPYRQSKGATGIDMGAGGEGTDISGK